MKNNIKKHPLVNIRLTSNGHKATLKNLDHVVYYHTGSDWSGKDGYYLNKGALVYEVLANKLNHEDFILLKVFYNKVIRVFDLNGSKHILIDQPQHTLIQEQIEALTDSLPINGEGFLIVFKDGGIKALCNLFNLYNEMTLKIDIQS